jgi:tripartite ATP-independent transporter DctM subunit
MATVAACTAFGAVIGDNLTGSIAMTAIGLPEMRRFKYDDLLSIGALTCSGTLGTLIPPSIIFILYGVLAQQSIAELFIAGIIPGLVCAIAFMLLVYVRCVRNPKLGLPTPRANWTERAVSLKAAAPIVLLFIIVIGGMYAGIFTATEGGGIGAFGALVIALAMRRLKWRSFSNAIVESAKLNCMSFALLGGSMIFGYALTTSRLPYVMADYVGTLAVHPMVIMLMIIIILFVLGCFIPAIPMLLITVPIFLPIAISLHWDLIWFGVIMVLMFNMATITPPFGINLFVMKGITGTSMGLVFRSAMPFVWVLLAVTALIIAFPPISTWLPYLLH